LELITVSIIYAGIILALSASGDYRVHKEKDKNFKLEEALKRSGKEYKQLQKVANEACDKLEEFKEDILNLEKIIESKDRLLADASRLINARGEDIKDIAELSKKLGEDYMILLEVMHDHFGVEATDILFADRKNGKTTYDLNTAIREMIKRESGDDE
jgi:hypothetical protein